MHKPKVMYVYCRLTTYVGTPVEFGQLEKVILTRLLMNGVASPTATVDLSVLGQANEVMSRFVKSTGSEIQRWKDVPTLAIHSSNAKINPTKTFPRKKSARLSSVTEEK